MKTFPKDLFGQWVALKYFEKINFHDSALFRYLPRTYFQESRMVTNIYRLENT